MLTGIHFLKDVQHN